MPDETYVIASAKLLEEGQQRVEVAELHESGDNPRQISDERFDALKYSISKDPAMLDARPLIVLPDGEVICGNMRLRAAKELGWKTIPAFVAKLDEATKREWMLRDNNEFGTWVPDELALLIEQHERDAGDMKMLGFSGQETKDLLKLAKGDTLPEAGDASTEPPSDHWGVVVECKNELAQVELLERLSEEGYECRALLA